MTQPARFLSPDLTNFWHVRSTFCTDRLPLDHINFMQQFVRYVPKKVATVVYIKTNVKNIVIVTHEMDTKDFDS